MFTAGWREEERERERCTAERERERWRKLRMLFADVYLYC